MKKAICVLLFFSHFFLLTVLANALDKIPYVFAQSEEEYIQFIQKDKLPPEPFLFYEDLSFLGDFKSFHISNEDMESYSYDFYNENDVRLSFVKAPSIANYWGDEVLPPEGNFVKNVYAEKYFIQSQKENIRCHSQVGQFVFVYLKDAEWGAKITAIHWFREDNSAVFSLKGMDKLNLSKPLEGFLGDLLSAERSETARQQLYDLTVHGKKFEYPPAPFPWVWVALPVGVALLGGTLTTAILLRKKKKR